MIRASIFHRYPAGRRPSVQVRQQAAAARRLMCGAGLSPPRPFTLPDAPLGWASSRFRTRASVAMAAAEAGAVPQSAPVDVGAERMVDPAVQQPLPEQSIAVVARLSPDAVWARVPEWLQQSLSVAWEGLRARPERTAPACRDIAAVAARVAAPQQWIAAVGLERVVLAHLPHIQNNAAAIAFCWLTRTADDFDLEITQSELQTCVHKMCDLLDLFREDRERYAEAAVALLQWSSPFFLQLLGLIDVVSAEQGAPCDYAHHWHAAIETAFARQAARDALSNWAETDYAALGAAEEEDLRRQATLLVSAYAVANAQPGRLTILLQAARLDPDEVDVLGAALERCRVEGTQAADVVEALRRHANTLRTAGGAAAEKSGGQGDA